MNRTITGLFDTRAEADAVVEHLVRHDMVARNAKLRRRAERMLGELTGCEAEAGRAALEAAGGKVKLAVLILRGLTRQEAEAALTAHGGDLRRAIAGAAAGGQA